MVRARTRESSLATGNSRLFLRPFVCGAFRVGGAPTLGGNLPLPLRSHQCKSPKFSGHNSPPRTVAASEPPVPSPASGCCMARPTRASCKRQTSRAGYLIKRSVFAVAAQWSPILRTETPAGRFVAAVQATQRQAIGIEVQHDFVSPNSAQQSANQVHSGPSPQASARLSPQSITVGCETLTGPCHAKTMPTRTHAPTGVARSLRIPRDMSKAVFLRSCMFRCVGGLGFRYAMIYVAYSC
jgi:hypothetical protein